MSPSDGALVIRANGLILFKLLKLAFTRNAALQKTFKWNGF